MVGVIKMGEAWPCTDADGPETRKHGTLDTNIQTEYRISGLILGRLDGEALLVLLSDR